mmetsp:Transcript_100209/g.259107  ORF Transcript_100209/g.259107 Transcript_100209/m.259107 type:complete len:304 (+) Transcript_100209:133-1044(+)
MHSHACERTLPLHRSGDLIDWDTPTLETEPIDWVIILTMGRLDMPVRVVMNCWGLLGGRQVLKRSWQRRPLARRSWLARFVQPKTSRICKSQGPPFMAAIRANKERLHHLHRPFNVPSIVHLVDGWVVIRTALVGLVGIVKGVVVEGHVAIIKNEIPVLCMCGHSLAGGYWVIAILVEMLAAKAVLKVLAALLDEVAGSVQSGCLHAHSVSGPQISEAVLERVEALGQVPRRRLQGLDLVQQSGQLRIPGRHGGLELGGARADEFRGVRARDPLSEHLSMEAGPRLRWCCEMQRTTRRLRPWA